MIIKSMIHGCKKIFRFMKRKRDIPQNKRVFRENDYRQEYERYWKKHTTMLESDLTIEHLQENQVFTQCLLNHWDISKTIRHKDFYQFICDIINNMSKAGNSNLKESLILYTSNTQYNRDQILPLMFHYQFEKKLRQYYSKKTQRLPIVPKRIIE